MAQKENFDSLFLYANQSCKADEKATSHVAKPESNTIKI